MFYEGDPIYLYIVDFDAEFNGFGFLASDNGTKVMPVDTTIRSDTFLPANKYFPCSRTLCMTEKRLW